ncbi:bifunctional diguanylate cyclase/phosphodiesterase [Rhizobium redzepovicii]|uniref:bifunctional diguanylate cyclase/phosphodiesterase n=1 Tax=Rhizobium TaxID=379 RepID=UPI001C9341D4|nr:EAL domain-containing protein [Rhizobium redzepovicii]MBY4612181.1 EAL domain-containing protein [Rhizobium redzepovicii]
MFTVLSCIADQHDWTLLFVALSICCFGSLTAVFMLTRAQECVRQHHHSWLIAAAVVLGASTWATHFIAMLAYAGPVPIGYDGPLIILSIIAAVVLFAVAVEIALMEGGQLVQASGGVLFGVAIAAMHFVGLLAITPFSMVSLVPDKSIVACALAIGFGIVAVAALRHSASRRFHIFAGAACIVLAICSLHTVSMSGVQITPSAEPVHADLSSVDRIAIAIAVSVISTLILLGAAAALFLDRHLTDLRGLANASFEGLVIAQENVVIDLNEKFAAMAGKAAAFLKGQPVEAVLAIERRLGIDTCQGAVLRDGQDMIPVEILARTIEYRGRECQVIAVRDLTERHEASRRIEHMARHDPLTGLANRREFDRRFEMAIAGAAETPSGLALFALDLDRFKLVNDTFGHAAGDAVLQRVAQVLVRTLPADVTIARMGGDEFSIILENASRQQTEALSADLQHAFAQEFADLATSSGFGASIGIALYPEHGVTDRRLRNNADMALYRAKSGGRGRACTFEAAMDIELHAKRQLEHDLRHAVAKGELFLVYQRIVDTSSQEPCGYEALLRWRHASRGVLAPADFIAAAEETGCIIPIGIWVLEEACSEAASWKAPLTIAVNISPVQFLMPNLVEQFSQILAKTGLQPDRLELEITETALFRDRAAVLSTLGQLRAMGIRVVLDDFGTGYSSLAHLRDFPFDKLKIDRRFLAGIGVDPTIRALFENVIEMASTLNLPVIAEGVETQEQLSILHASQPAQMQGFLFGKPEAAPSSRAPLKAIA